MTEHCKHDLTDNCHLCREPDASHAADWVTTGHARGPDGEEIELGHVAGVTSEPIGAAELVASAVRRSVAGAWELARSRNDAEGGFASYNLTLLGALYDAERRCQVLMVERDKWIEALRCRDRILIDAKIERCRAALAKLLAASEEAARAMERWANSGEMSGSIEMSQRDNAWRLRAACKESSEAEKETR